MWSFDLLIHYHNVQFYCNPSPIFSLYIIHPSTLCHHGRWITPRANVSCSVYPTVNLVLSCPVLSCLVLSCPILSYLILSYLITGPYTWTSHILRARMDRHRCYNIRNATRFVPNPGSTGVNGSLLSAPLSTGASVSITMTLKQWFAHLAFIEKSAMMHVTLNMPLYSQSSMLMARRLICNTSFANKHGDWKRAPAANTNYMSGIHKKVRGLFSHSSKFVVTNCRMMYLGIIWWI